jgi:2-polyprenyl-6-hydroxyphenyl methylase / 3-demethylubiquinone-9 3-methyltransferase
VLQKYDMTESANVDIEEVAKFSDSAERWWDLDSDFRPLHDLNPVRISWINRIISLKGQRVADIGCGGGILSEGMAKLGALVTGVDMSEQSLAVARAHAREHDHKIDYQHTAVEPFAAEHPGIYDVITCLEMLEHVPDPSSVVRACAQLVKPGGHVFFSTINRNSKAYVMAVVGAEYVLGLLPRGTHDYSKFIRPGELSGYCRKTGLEVDEIVGMHYDPFRRTAELCDDPSVNYLLHARRIV